MSLLARHYLSLLYVSHKGFAAFSLGSSLFVSGSWIRSARGRRFMLLFVLAGVYVAVDIIGKGVGMGLREAFEENSSVVEGIPQALLGGSFLFVSPVELIPGELEQTRKYDMPVAPS